MQWIIPGIITSYFIGSIPTAYLFGRILKGIDIRKLGSGNVGATNALRVLGKGPAIAVLVLDILKGFFVVVFVGNIVVANSNYSSEILLRTILGLAVIMGHNWTVFLGFKGGKGIATTLGVLLGLALVIPGLKLVLGLVVLVWLLIFLFVMIVSFASIVAAISLPLFMLLFRQDTTLILLSILLCGFVILRHKSNLKRIFQGKEPRINFKKK